MNEQPSHRGPTEAADAVGTNGNGRVALDRPSRQVGGELDELSMSELLHGLARSVAEAQRQLELDDAAYELAEAIIDVKVSLRVREVHEADANGARRTTEVFGSVVAGGTAATGGDTDDLAAGVRIVLRPTATPPTGEWPAEREPRAGWS